MEALLGLFLIVFILLYRQQIRILLHTPKEKLEDHYTCRRRRHRHRHRQAAATVCHRQTTDHHAHTHIHIHTYTHGLFRCRRLPTGLRESCWRGPSFSLYFTFVQINITLECLSGKLCDDEHLPRRVPESCLVARTCSFSSQPWQLSRSIILNDKWFR